MKKPEITQLNCIEMLPMLYALQAQECEEYGIPIPQLGTSGTLPDGSDDIRNRLWDWFRQDHHGNQQFGNDRFYRISFECDEHGELYEPDLSPDEKKVIEYAKDALNDDGDNAFLLFYISW
jgi:hypothetical protein